MTPVTRALAAGASVLAVTTPAVAQSISPTLISQADDSYFNAARAELEALLARQPNVREAKNVILFVGDGMSIPTITAARILEGQQAGGDGESNHLAFEDLLPHVALVEDLHPRRPGRRQRPDRDGHGRRRQVEQRHDRRDPGGRRTTTAPARRATRSRRSSRLAEAAGYATGIVSTARITHATPAATYAKTAQRDWENDSQLSRRGEGQRLQGHRRPARRLAGRRRLRGDPRRRPRELHARRPGRPGGRRQDRRPHRRPRPRRRVAGEVQRRRLRLEQGGLRRRRPGHDRPPAGPLRDAATCSTRPIATTARRASRRSPR